MLSQDAPEPAPAGSQAIEEVNKKLSSSLFRRVIGRKVVTTVEPFDGEYWMAEVRTVLRLMRCNQLCACWGCVA